MLRRIGRILLLAIGGFLIGSVFLVAIYRVLPPPVTPLMLIRAAEGHGIAKRWRPLSEISPPVARGGGR